MAPKILYVFSILLFVTGSLFGKDAENPETCDYCHAVGRENAPIVKMELIDKSVHEGSDCDECHEEVEAALHEEKPALVNCGTCHEDEAEIYQQHGIPKVGSTPFTPRCADCHGSHSILSSDNPDSKTHVSKLNETCGSCHENPEVIAQHPFLPDHPVLTYQSSVHGKIVATEETEAVSCISCHGTGQSAHLILATGNLESSINHFAISETCGECHNEINTEYIEGIHGQLMLRGKTNSPTCTNCHGEHSILSTTDSRSGVSPAHVAKGTCIPCHQSATLSEKYGMPSGELASFIDPFHGLKSKSDGEAVATCSSCHEAHKILPHTDPESSIHPDNLRKTCGECHEDISDELAKTPIHYSQNFASKGWPLVFTIIYYILIAVTLTAMILYILLDLWRYVKNLTKKEQVPRMTKGDILQHSLLLVAFIVLVLTGFALRFSDSWWANLLFGKTGAFSQRSLIHRSAGVVLILTSLMHLVYLKGKNGREFLKQIVPGWSDFKKLAGMLRYNLGLSQERPALGKFSYVEKFEYWALIWGTIIMSVTGVILWFDNTFIHYLSRTGLEVVRVIHYYEAWLATLSILIWHLYSTVFSPGVYPMNPAWITGTMPKDQYQHEHGD